MTSTPSHGFVFRMTGVIPAYRPRPPLTQGGLCAHSIGTEPWVWGPDIGSSCRMPGLERSRLCLRAESTGGRRFSSLADLAPPSLPTGSSCSQAFLCAGHAHSSLTGLGASENRPLPSSCGDAPTMAPSRKDLQAGLSHKVNPGGEGAALRGGAKVGYIKGLHHNLTSIQFAPSFFPSQTSVPCNTLRPKLRLGPFQRTRPTAVPFTRAPAPPCSQFPSACI